jgi:hypothetical protein
MNNEIPDKNELQARMILEAIAILHKQGFGRLKIFCYVKAGLGAWRHNLFAADYFPEKLENLPLPIAHGTLPGWPVSGEGSPEAIALQILNKHPQLCANAKGNDEAYVGWFSTLLKDYPNDILEMEGPNVARIVGHDRSLPTPYNS